MTFHVLFNEYQLVSIDCYFSYFIMQSEQHSTAVFMLTLVLLSIKYEWILLLDGAILVRFTMFFFFSSALWLKLNNFTLAPFPFLDQSKAEVRWTQCQISKDIQHMTFTKWAKILMNLLFAEKRAAIPKIRKICIINAIL